LALPETILPKAAARFCVGVAAVLVVLCVLLAVVESVSASYLYTNVPMFNSLLTVADALYCIIGGSLSVAFTVSAQVLRKMVRDALKAAERPSSGGGELSLRVIYRHLTITFIFVGICLGNCVLVCFAMGAFRYQVWANPGLSIFFQVMYHSGPQVCTLALPLIIFML